MLHCLRYWRCRWHTRRLRSGSEWASAWAVMWPARRFANTDITRIIPIAARPTDTTVRVGSRTASLSAPGPGTATAGHVHTTPAPMPAVLLAAATTDTG